MKNNFYFLLNFISSLKGIPDIYAENVKRFMDRVIPEVYKKVQIYSFFCISFQNYSERLLFSKLHDSLPVQKWNHEIQLGVYEMTNLVLELIAIRLNQKGFPEILLNTLNLVNTKKNFFL